jgi:hypothetical protein
MSAAGGSRVGLDEERRAGSNVPEDLVAGDEIGLPAEEPPVPLRAGVEIGHRHAGDQIGQLSHIVLQSIGLQCGRAGGPPIIGSNRSHAPGGRGRSLLAHPD